jgi:hypothetical protein
VSIPAAQALLGAAEFGTAKQNLTAAATLSGWGATSAMLGFHLGAGDGAAAGGELAQPDGIGATLLAASMVSAQAADTSDLAWKEKVRQSSMVGGVTGNLM